MEQFPPNSKKAEDPPRPPKRVEQVTAAGAVRRKRSLGKQFKSTFVSGDAQTAWQYVIFNVVVPSAKDLLADAATSMVERVLFGDSRPKGRGPGYGGLGHVAYNRISPGRPSGPPQPKALSRASRARHDFDEIVIQTRGEAEEVLERLGDLVDMYESATVADLYELTGLENSHTDHKWGWTSMRGAAVARLRSGGFVLDLPDPQPLG